MATLVRRCARCWPKRPDAATHLGSTACGCSSSNGATRSRKCSNRTAGQSGPRGSSRTWETRRRPAGIGSEMGNGLPTDGAVVVDTLQASVWSGSFMPLKGATQRFIRCAGSLGWGFPASIGAKCALGSRPAVCFTGDGGFYYHLAELETAARYEIPVVVVVNNNGAYGADRRSEPNPYTREASPEADLSWKFGPDHFAQ